MSEYTGKAGTIYTRQSDESEPRYEVWYEDFCELGAGPTEAEALQDAFKNTADILTLISEASIKANPLLQHGSGELSSQK